MTFQIHALPYEDYANYFDMDDATLAKHKAVRQTVRESPGVPCRVSLDDAKVGETVVLLNYSSITGKTPYAATHAIFVRENAPQAAPAPTEVPDVLARRTLSVRALDDDGMIRSACVAEGKSISPVIEDLFADADIAEIHLHIAGPGCFAARVTRAPATQ